MMVKDYMQNNKKHLPKCFVVAEMLSDTLVGQQIARR